MRARVRERLRQNAEVVGTDEAFFEDDDTETPIRDLFTEKSGVLDDDDDAEVDLASQALEIWNQAVKANPELNKIISEMPNVVYSTKAHAPTPTEPEGVLVILEPLTATMRLHGLTTTVKRLPNRSSPF